MHRKCDHCNQWQKDYGKDVACQACPDGEYKNSLNICTPEYVMLGKTKASKRQLGELERRVRLPYKKPGGGYYLGRRGENGKIQEKWPDYRS